MKLSFISLLAVTLPSVSALCPSAVTAGDSCSTNIFGGSGSISTTCSDDNDSVSVAGNVYINKAFDDSLEVTAVPCIMGVMCYPEYSQNLGGFCDLATHQAGQSCGTAGGYMVNAATFDVPAEAESYMGMAKLKLYLNLDEDCEAERTTNRFSRWLGFSVIPVAGLATLIARRRRRRPLLTLEGATDNFVEMGSVQQTGTMV